MKKTIIPLLIVFIISTLFLSGCNSDPVQKDIINYMNNELPKVSALEAEAIEKYRSVVGQNYKDDKTLYDALKTQITPKYKEFIQILEGIKPETEELQQVHGVFVKAANTQYEAFILIMEAIDKGDASLIDKANTKLDEGESGIDKYQKDLNELAKKHNVEISDKK